MSRTIDFTDYNESRTETRQANLSFVGNPLGITSSKLKISKFKITSSDIPVWIPDIVNGDPLEKYTIPLYTEMPLHDDYKNLTWNTDISACVSDNVNKTYSNVCVKYNPIYSQHIRDQPTPGVPIGRLAVLTNRFFYTYTSLELLEMIQDAFTAAMVAIGVVIPNPIVVVKNESSYQFYLHSTLDPNRYSIYVNIKFKKMFNLQYRSSLDNMWRLIPFKGKISYSLGDDTYIASITLSYSTCIFPFNNLVFTGSLNTRQIEKISGSSMTVPNSISEIFSYYLTISDIDAAGDCFFFIADTEFNPSDIGGDIQNIKLNAYFQTIDGFNVPLMLTPLDSILLTMLFTDSPDI